MSLNRCFWAAERISPHRPRVTTKRARNYLAMVKLGCIPTLLSTLT
ncbi:hypothetical protein SGB_03688 [Shigella boydii ATCC 9905]|nr:hypothetical protein SGB_03688 [Shigella boydii ATCC 9905]